MTVQRQYTLPNCNLMVEGLSSGDETDPLAPLTIVLNTEFTFAGATGSFSGGRELLEAIAKTVSSYAQSLLSGIPYPLAEAGTDTAPVTLQPGEHDRHQLTATTTDADGNPVAKTVVLNTVQLFDLMEAVDQLLADSQTLPDMTLQLSSLQRRHSRPAEPVAKRVVPAAAGLSALAASAALLFVLPVPEVDPDRIRDEQNDAAQVEEGTSDTGDVPGITDDDADAEDALDAELTEEQVSAAAALSRLNSAPEITDADTLADLQAELEETLTADLASPIPFEESLVYRVAVSETGDVLGYKYENDPALLNADSTPLPDLLYVPVESASPTAEPVAQFRVTFDPDGEVTAEPIASADGENP